MMVILKGLKMNNITKKFNNFKQIKELKNFNVLASDYIDTELEIKELNKFGINYLTNHTIKQSKKRKRLLRKMNKELKMWGFS